MENEISSGTMLGMILIALAAVIGLSFMVFSVAKGITNEGVVDMQSNLGQAMESVYGDYDQKIITGTQVTSAYKTFQGKPIAILINTQASQKGVKTYKDHTLLRVFSVGGLNYINYNAILGGDSEGLDPIRATQGSVRVPEGAIDVIDIKEGVATTEYGYSVGKETGEIIMDTSIAGITKAGNAEYIAANSKYNTNLIEDKAGNIMGIIITQIEQ